jgi:Flp pilus assembly protein TadD
LGDTLGALAAILRDIELRPNSSSSYFHLAKVFAARGDASGVLQAIQGAVQSAPGDVKVINKAAWRLAAPAGAPESLVREGLALAQRAAEMAPNDAATWNTLGVALYRAGQTAESIDAFEKSMALSNGGDAFDWLFLGMAHWKRSDPPQARAWLQKADEWMKQKQPPDAELASFREEAHALIDPSTAEASPPAPAAEGDTALK